MDDRWAYRLAVGFVGLALVAFVIGVAVVAAAGKMVPQQLWDAGSALAGAVLGILQPQPRKPSVTAPLAEITGSLTVLRQPARAAWQGLSDFARELWLNRSVVILLGIFGVSIAFGAHNNAPELRSLAAAAGGVLIGILVPTPSR